MKTRVIAQGAEDAPNIDTVYPEGLSAGEMARLMQTYPCLDVALLEAIPREAVDRAFPARDPSGDFDPMVFDRKVLEDSLRGEEEPTAGQFGVEES